MEHLPQQLLPRVGLAPKQELPGAMVLGLYPVLQGQAFQSPA
jgi:hypothetical protein